MEITGFLSRKIETREGDSTYGHWIRASYMIDTAGVEPYPHRMMVEVKNGETGRIAKFDALMGKKVTVRFDIDAREYNGRWYNTISAYAIEEVIEEPKKEKKAEPDKPAGEEVDWNDMGKGAGADAPATVTEKAGEADGEPKADGVQKDEGQKPEGAQLYWGDKAQKTDDLPF